MMRLQIASTLAFVILAAPAANAGDGRWNAVQNWTRKLPPDANISRTVQNGNGNGSSTVQLGGGNISVIHQSGDGNSAEALQAGRGNVSAIIQLGNANSASVQQTGDGNVSRSIQVGDGLTLARRQNGGGRASSVQLGDRPSKETKHLLRRAEKSAWRNVKQVVKDIR